MQHPRDQEHGPAGVVGGRLLEVADRHEPLLDEESEELVLGAVRARPDDRLGRLDHERRVEVAADQDETAGHAEHGLARERLDLRRGRGNGGYGRGRGAGLAIDGPDGPLELLLRDRDDLGGDAARVGEGEYGRLLAHEEHGAGALLFGVAGGAAGGAVVAARGVVASEQPVGFLVADLGAYLVTDVEHARHWGSLNSVRAPGCSRLIRRQRTICVEGHASVGPGSRQSPRTVRSAAESLTPCQLVGNAWKLSE